MGAVHIPIIDEDALDDLVTAVQALSAPSATSVAVDATGMDIITAENAQGALKQLDTAVDEVNASLTNYNVTDLTATVKSVYSSITSDSNNYFKYIKINKWLGMICCQFKTSSAISSGAVDLATLIPDTRTKVNSSLSAQKGGGGFMQLESHTLIIRCTDSNNAYGDYFCGQIIFPLTVS